MINYVLYILIFQLLFLITYDLFHKKDTFFSLNRLYLLVTSALSFVLPFIKIKSIPENIPDAYVINLPTIVIGQQPTQELTPIIDVATKATQTISESSTYFSFETLNWWLILYCIGTGFMFIRFIKKIFSLWKLRKKSSFTYISGYKTYTIPNSKDAFSFYNAIYVGDELNTEEKKLVIVHETVHLYQKHSLDLLWFEFLKIIFWFNPLVYIYQSRIDTLHEFIADTKSVGVLGKRKYYEQLLYTTFEAKEIDFINQFSNHSLLKKRIAMLQKSKSNTIAKFKYLLLIPILGVMLTFSSFVGESDKVNDAVFQEKNVPKHSFTSTKDTPITQNKKVANQPLKTKKNIESQTNSKKFTNINSNGISNTHTKKANNTTSSIENKISKNKSALSPTKKSDPSNHSSKYQENNPEPGYYLITGIFKYQKYLDKALEKLKKTGLEPRFFKNPEDGYFYTYLKRYDRLEKAKEMLSSNINDTYQGDLYIFKMEQQ